MDAKKEDRNHIDLHKMKWFCWRASKWTSTNKRALSKNQEFEPLWPAAFDFTIYRTCKIMCGSFTKKNPKHLDLRQISFLKWDNNVLKPSPSSFPSRSYPIFALSCRQKTTKQTVEQAEGICFVGDCFACKVVLQGSSAAPSQARSGQTLGNNASDRAAFPAVFSTSNSHFTLMCKCDAWNQMMRRICMNTALYRVPSTKRSDN